ncbi:hypothetical protein EDD21DRAFT_189308 [Dissophora ornata]|nr:hypothetical protein EDD21DRAFT_189308 [Dissophora ornata]
MFSSFKERLNTGLATRHATTHSTTATTSTSSTAPGTAAAAETPGMLADSHGDDESTPASALNSLVSPHSPTPSSTSTLTSTASSSFHGSSSSFVSLASRISGGVASTSSSALFFRRPAQTKLSADLAPAHSSSSSAQALSGEIGLAIGVGGGSNLARLVQQLTLDPKEEKVDPAELDKIREIYRQQRLPDQQRKKLEEPAREQDDQQGGQQDQLKNSEEEQQKSAEPAGTELSEAVIEKLELLQRYEARFPGEKMKISHSYHKTRMKSFPPRGTRIFFLFSFIPLRLLLVDHFILF